MENLKIVIKGNPTTKKNHSQIINVGGKRRVIPSKQYKKYEESFLIDCMEQKAWNKNINYPIEVKCLYYMQTRRRVDLTNLLSATDDALQTAKVITDDCASIIASHDGSRVYYDKENPRTEIYITPYVGADIFP